MDGFSTFGQSAKGLARNPLGIIALFIVLVYGFASLVTTTGSLQSGERLPLIWFLVLFPVLVLFVFGWLVSCHHRKLYAPADFKDEHNFIAAINPELMKLTKVSSDSVNIPALASVEQTDGLGWPTERQQIYESCRNIFIAHLLHPSQDPNQLFDVFIYLVRHKRDDFSDVKSVQFFFGRHWGNKVFDAEKIDGLFGIRTSAQGPFLCVCRVTMTDGVVLHVHRYIDFEMGKAIAGQPKRRWITS
jgi:hypothetical protein